MNFVSESSTKHRKIPCRPSDGVSNFENNPCRPSDWASNFENNPRRPSDGASNFENNPRRPSDWASNFENNPRRPSDGASYFENNPCRPSDWAFASCIIPSGILVVLHSLELATVNSSQFVHCNYKISSGQNSPAIRFQL